MQHVPFPWSPTPVPQPPRKCWRCLPVFQDYHSYVKFGKWKNVFPNSSGFAHRAMKEAAAEGKTAAILLTDKEGTSAFKRHEHDGPVLFFIVNVDRMRTTSASAVDTALAKEGVVGLADAEKQFLDKFRATGAKFEAFLKNEISANIILAWCAEHPERVKSLAEAIATLGDQDIADLTPFALEVLAALGGTVKQIEEFAKKATEPALYLGGAAALYARQYLATEELDRLIKADAVEHEFQKLFEKHHWMFGPHYAARVDRRVFTVGSQYDIPLIATDGFLDLIELKRPKFELFKRDDGHGCLQPSAELAQALGQAQHYVATNDAEVYTISQRFKVPAHRMRATIIIGKFEDDDEEQRRALRTLNSHLNRIEVRTFTDVLASARAIQRYTAEVLAAAKGPNLEAEPG